jgi:diguanylate cyclase (GGDEF)-like protein
MERLGQAVLANARSHKVGAVLLLDLDHFKWVNDNLGHDMGDVVLQQVAARLQERVRHSDTVARLGGDEFVVLLQNLGNSIAEAQVLAQVMARKIVTTLRMPFNLEGHEHTLGASVGIALFAGEDRTADSLLKEADQAMYAAKRTRTPALPLADCVSEACAPRGDSSPP